MTTTLIFLTLAVSCFGQLIYPDDYTLMRSTTVPPYPLTTIRRQAPFPLQNNFAYSYQTNLPLQPPLSGSSRINPIQQQRKYSALSNPRMNENSLQDWGDHVNNIIVTGILKFALDMEREIYRNRNTSLIEQRDNIVFSPISLSVTLAIVLAGSAGRTFDEVAKVLGLETGVDISRNSEIVHQMFGLMLAQLHNKINGSPGPRVDFATATYVQDGYPILPQFKALSDEVYENEVINVDFIRNGRAAQDMINAWVKQKTMGKISSILNDVPGPETTVILLSALYFNGEWNQYFLDGATKRKPFFIEPEESVLVDMMYNGGTFPFYEDKQLGVKILALPYKGQEISMYILLPTAKGAKALRDFQNKLTVDIIENLIRNMKNETCIIGLPRMKLTSSLSLRSTLSQLGLISLFDPATADLSLMSQPTNVNTNRLNPTASATVTPLNRPSKSNSIPQNQQQENNDVLIFSRSDPTETKTGHMVKRDFFTYEDTVGGYTVKQWSNGFTIKKNRKIRDTKEDRNTYTVKDGSKVEDNAKVVNLEGNKYRFQEKEQRGRSRRQSRPIDEDFLNYIRQRNFPSYGLDDLRNTANLINPHLFASDVLHKVEIDITEKGTEAAAVTSVVLERDGSQRRLIANRPFIFFIRHDPSRLVLFWGTLNTPTPNYPVT